MKSVSLTLRSNEEVMFEAYCHMKGMSAEDVFSKLARELVSENEEEILDWLKAGSPAEGVSEIHNATDEVPIYKRYKGKKYEAVFSKSRQMVKLDGVWMAPSGAAWKITLKSWNGWIFWKYRDEMGHEHLISDLRAR